MKLFQMLSTVVIFLAALFVLALLMSYPTLWLVNYLFTPALLAYVFGATKITFWQAFALNTLVGTVHGQGKSSNSKSND